MLTKEQKVSEVSKSSENIKASKSIIFVDFSGVSVEDISNLKAKLREAGATFKVTKKRLLKIALDKAGIAFDPLAYKAPVGTVYGTEEMTSVAGPVYKFAAELKKKDIPVEVLGAFDGENKTVLSAEEFTVIAKLPSREVLLAQIMGGITGPLRAFMSIVDQLSKKAPEEKKEEPKAEAPAPEKPAEEAASEEKKEEPASPAEEPKSETKEEPKVENN